jgi:hypothetical protein
MESNKRSEMIFMRTEPVCIIRARAQDRFEEGRERTVEPSSVQAQIAVFPNRGALLNSSFEKRGAARRQMAG